ncbi:uncharacterized protein LOC142355435 isoform X2 [Convolutriloba macropyga]
MTATVTQSESTGGNKMNKFGVIPTTFEIVDGVEGKSLYLSEPDGTRYTYFEAKKQCEDRNARLFEPKDETERNLVDQHFKERFSADKAENWQHYWLGYANMEYKSHVYDISLSPAKWRSVTTLKETSYPTSGFRNKGSFAYTGYGFPGDAAFLTLKIRYMCEKDR